MTPRVFLRFLLFVLSCLRPTWSFSVAALLPTKSSDLQVSALFANKVNKKNKSKKKPSTSGGFGGSSSSTNPKVREVTGFQGSGTKPLRMAANTFDKLRDDYGTESVSDVYVRSPKNDPTLFWFVGKVARCVKEDDLQGTAIPTPEEAAISQKRLILEYSKRELRPQNMGGPFAEGLELWLAPGDSELESVQNKVSFDKVEGSLTSLSDGFHVNDVGYNPEIYVGDEVQDGGLRVVRDDDGNPVKAVFEINEAV